MVFFLSKRSNVLLGENVVAMWLTQVAQPTYRTIARFVVSDTIEMMQKSSFSEFREHLRKNGLIDEAVFIDGHLKILITQINTRLFGRKILFAMMI